LSGEVAGFQNHSLEEAIAACDYSVITLAHTPFQEKKELIASKPYYDCVGLMR
jgi:UDP-N-acetyl-D-mannosaminuronic acid dehydrogenase